jgi:LmbE family N-acetylglucosaminyl deacetylase
MIGAHPDDEDTQLIAFLAKGRHIQTAYLALTRGDGGQNLIGNELGELLGMIRTEELLAELVADEVLAAVAARQREIRRLDVAPFGEKRDELSVFVVRMRPDHQNARGRP